MRWTMRNCKCSLIYVNPHACDKCSENDYDVTKDERFTRIDVPIYNDEVNE